MHFFVDKWAFMYDWWYTFTTLTLVLLTLIRKSYPSLAHLRLCHAAFLSLSTRRPLEYLCSVMGHMYIILISYPNISNPDVYCTSFPHTTKTASRSLFLSLSPPINAATHPHPITKHARQSNTKQKHDISIRIRMRSRSRWKQKKRVEIVDEQISTQLNLNAKAFVMGYECRQYLWAYVLLYSASSLPNTLR